LLRSPIKIYRLPQTVTWGITNRTRDNYFVLFLDYDKVEYNVVLEDIDFLQKNFDVGTVITRVSSLQNYKEEEVGNYHVIGFTKFTFPEVREMIKLTRCDSHFKSGYVYQQRAWVLRIGEKIDFDGNVVKRCSFLRDIIPAKTSRTANLAMITFFEKLDKIKLLKYFERVDGISEMEVISYATKR